MGEYPCVIGLSRSGVDTKTFGDQYGLTCPNVELRILDDMLICFYAERWQFSLASGIRKTARCLGLALGLLVIAFVWSKYNYGGSLLPVKPSVSPTSLGVVYIATHAFRRLLYNACVVYQHLWWRR